MAYVVPVCELTVSIPVIVPVAVIGPPLTPQVVEMLKVVPDARFPVTTHFPVWAFVNVTVTVLASVNVSVSQPISALELSKHCVITAVVLRLCAKATDVCVVNVCE
jgi:hypothetical protein